MHQRSQFLAKTLAMAQLEKGDNGNEHCDMRPTEIQQSKKNVESVVEAFENLLNTLDVEDKEGIYFISSGLCVTLDIQEDLLKADRYGKEVKDKFIRERLATRINSFDPIKRSKLKTFESANKKVMVKTLDKRLIEYKQQGNLAFQLLVQAQSLDEKINLKLLMPFPLTPVLLSIGTSDGMLLKTDNVKGMRYLLTNQLSPEKPDKNFTLVIEYGKALFYALKDIPRNFKEIF